MSKKDGGAAFPTTKLVEEKYMDDMGYGRTRMVNRPHGGMSLRDYFAATALNAFLTWSDAQDISAEAHAKAAYDLADAMIKEREL